MPKLKSLIQPLLLTAAVALAATGCLGDDPQWQIDGPPRVDFVASNPKGFEQSSLTVHSIVFSEQDAAREGLPTEIPLDQPRGTTDLQGSVHFENHFIGEISDVAQIPCFERPIQLRNDSTNEIVATLDEFCPNGQVTESITIVGIYEDDREAEMGSPAR